MNYGVSTLALLISLVLLFSTDGYKEVIIKDSGKLEKRVERIETELELEDKEKILGLEEEPDYDALLLEHKRDNEGLAQSTTKLSPSGKKTAYFQHKFITNIKEIGDGDYTSLVVEHEGTKETVFQNDFRLGSFEWLNDGEIVVYRGCGTECRIAYIVNIETKIPHEFTLGVGYTWSPDKRYVLAYHYSYKYGISVSERGDLYGRMVFELRREHPPSGSALGNKTQASWSPDSKRLALIIKKQDKEQLELLVFDVENGFRPLLQKDLEDIDFSEVGWRNIDTVFYAIGGKAFEVSAS